MPKEIKIFLHSLCLMFVLSPFTPWALEGLGVVDGDIIVYLRMLLGVATLSFVASLTFLLLNIWVDEFYLIGFTCWYSATGMATASYFLYGFMWPILNSQYFGKRYLAVPLILTGVLYLFYYKLKKWERSGR